MKNIRTRKIIGAAMLAAVSFGAFASFLPFIRTKLDVVLWNALPMNILKGLSSPLSPCYYISGCRPC